MDGTGTGAPKGAEGVIPMELRVPPPVVFTVCAVIMRALAWALPALEVSVPAIIRGGVAVFLFVLGLASGVLGLTALQRAGTTSDPRRPDRAAVLVTSGIYGYTRNPMYLGLAAALLGWAVWLSNVAALVGVVGFMAYVHRFQILPEERALAARFGQAYEEYRRSVPRWL